MPSDATLAHQKALEDVDFDFIQGPQSSSLLKRRVAELAESECPLGVDTETTGLDPLVNQVRLIQVAVRDYALIVDLDGWRTEGVRQVPWEAPGLMQLRALLEGRRKKVLQNAAFDLNFLKGEGLELGGSIFDTMIAAKVINNGTGAKNDLGSIVNRVLKVPMPKELQKANWAGEITPEMVQYAARDAVCLPRLAPLLMEALRGEALTRSVTLLDVFDLEMNALRPIARMQWNGFGFDAVAAAKLQVSLHDHAETLKTRFLEELDQAIKQEHPDDRGVWLPRDPDGTVNTREKDSGSIRLGTKRYKGFNPRSPQQMAERFEQAGILLSPNEKGLPSLDQNLLAFLKNEYELVALYLEWKNAVTRVSHIEKLLDSLGPDGRIHANYRQMGTETGRLSCIAKGQRILAPNGAIAIENVKVGDYVYSLDANGAPVIKRVVNKWCNGKRPVVCVDWEAKGHQDPQYGSLICTPDHRIRTDRGWVEAQSLLPNEQIWHLRRSTKSERPRLYWRNYGSSTEQLIIIKESYFGKPGYEWHIHHKDHDKTNNCLTNLEVMPQIEHLRHHAASRRPNWLFTEESIRKSAAARTGKFIGADNAQWKHVSKFTLLRWLAEAGGRLTYIPMDFDVYKRKCKLAGLDLKALTRRYSANGIYLNKRAIELAYSEGRTIEHTAKLLGIGTRKLNDLMLAYGILRTNHRVLLVMPAGEAEVYDLEIEDTHNFIAEELCVHNCSGPNLQQVPREAEFRQLFRARGGYALVVADFSQVELRVAAELSGESRMLEAYKAGRDLHTETAALITGKDAATITKSERTSAKLCNFGLLYGAGAATLRKQAVAQYGVDMELDEATELVKGFREAYPELYAWQTQEGNKTTRCVFTRYGRRRRLIGFNDKFTTRINTQVQGTAGDIAKIALAMIWQKIVGAPVDEAFLIAMVHDEIVLEVREAVVEQWAALLTALMEAAGGVVCHKVPIIAEASYGATWADAK
jgi:DNA polymerase I-like protein with 3'-5' exonuclease and polymerase domains